MKKIRVAIVDDHKVFVQGLTSLLSKSKDVKVVLQCYDGKELLTELKNVAVDMVILDLEMPNLNGFDTAEFLTKRYPKIKVLALSMHKEESFILRIMELGAKGFLQKDVEIDQIENALYSIRDTGYYFTTALSRVMAKNIARNDKVTPFYFESKLTDREIEVLTLICEECTSTEIGERLYISPRTVENHRTRLLEKTGVKNTVGLVVYAIKRGYFDV